jgi:hypothetical protein
VYFTIEEIPADTDGDGAPDYWELANEYVPSVEGGGTYWVPEHNSDPLDSDSDDDGLNDGQEYERRTSPLLVDTDHDGLSDGDEVSLHRTSPSDADSDDDGLSDGYEVTHGTNPQDSDTDDDGDFDGYEVTHGTDPRAAQAPPDATGVFIVLVAAMLLIAVLAKLAQWAIDRMQGSA